MPIFSFTGYNLKKLFLENLTIDDKFMNKRVRHFIHQTMCQEEKHLYVITRLLNSCLITFLKKNAEAATGGVL